MSIFHSIPFAYMMHNQNRLLIFKMITKMQKDVYITQISGITPHSQNKSKSLSQKWGKKYKKKIKVSTKVWHWTVQNEIQWSGIRQITRFNHSLMTSKTHQFEPGIKHHKLIHSHLITYTYICTCVPYLTRFKSLDHTMSKQRNKIHSIQGRELTQKSSQTRGFTFSKRRSRSKSSF